MERIGDEVGRELSRFGPAAGMAELVRGWPGSVGEAIAANAWPARFTRDGTLIVHTADSVWAFELGQRGAEIAARAGVERMKFVPGPLPEANADTSEEPPRRVPTPSAEHVAEGERLAAEIEDQNLRKLVAKAAAASLAQAPADRGVW